MRILNEIWDFFKVNFKWLLVVAAILVLYFQGCFKRFEPTTPVVTHDTTYIIREYVQAPYTPPNITVLPPKVTVTSQPQYQADTSSIQALRSQFNDLVRKHTEQKVVTDRLTFDSSYVDVTDTISENTLKSRSYKANIKERTVLTTITERYKPRNQVYVNGGVSNIGMSNVINQLDVGVSLINKRNTMLQAGYVYNTDYHSHGFRVGIGKLIKLRK